MKIAIKRFDISIDNANQTYAKSFELEKNLKYVLGYAVTTSRDELLYHRGSQKLEINAEEILPDDYESKLLLTGINVTPDGRYSMFKEKMLSGNGIIKITYKDLTHPNTVFAAYRVSYYFKCEQV